MLILKNIYESIYKKPAPYYYNYNIIKILFKPIRKFAANVIASNCPFNFVRIWIYRLCGFKIGKKVFIGMKCYLDDTCYELITIGNDVTISYGVYFACHGKNQGHLPIIIEDNVYIGMRASIISKVGGRKGEQKGICIERGAVVGANSLVNCSIPSGKTAVGVPCRVI